jgi:hypothetical protein
VTLGPRICDRRKMACFALLAPAFGMRRRMTEKAPWEALGHLAHQTGAPNNRPHFVASCTTRQPKD